MISWIRRILAPPIFQDEEEKTRRASLLNSILLAMLVAVVVYVVFAPIDPAVQVRRLAFAVPFFLLLLGMFFLLRRGYVRVPSFLTVGGIWLLFTFVCFQSGGVFAPAFAGYIVVILCAGLLLGWKVGLISAVVSILAGLVMVYGENEHFLTSSDATYSALAIWLAESVFFFVGAVLLGLADHNLNTALKQARHRLYERQQAERKLRESEYRLRSALDAVNMGTWNWNTETGEVQWSEQIAPMFGLRPAEFAGTYSAYLELIHPADRPVVEASLAAVLEGQADSFRIEPRVIWPDGNIHWQEGRGQIFRDASGRPLYMTGTVVDITERKQFEEQLRQQQLRAEALAELSQLLAEVNQDYYQVLNIIVRRIGALIGDLCSIQLLSADGIWLERAARYYPDPEMFKFISEVMKDNPQRSDEGLSGQVIQSGQPVLMPVVTMSEAMTRIKPEYRVLMERYPTYSRLIVPLKAQGQIIGTLELTRTQPGRPYTINEQAFLQDLADRAGLAISNARLYSALQQELTERKQAEAALTRSQAMLNFAQQLGNLGSFVCELETRRILWSDQLYRITGFEPGEVKPTIKLAFSLIQPSSQRLLRALFREAFEQGHSQQEIPLVLRSGELRQVFIRTNVFYNAEGKPVSWVGTVLDITQSKKTEEALRRSEERYRSLVLASAQIIWIGKSEGRRAIEVTEMSDGWERLTGHPCQAVLGTGYLRLIHPADFPRVRAQWEQAVLKGLSFEMEHRIRCADGHYIYFQTRSVPIMDSNRKVQEWVGTMSDITARKQAEQALQESEERFRRLSEAAFEGIGISAEGRLLDANGRLAEMFGYELAEVIGKPVLDFVAPESVETVRKSLQFGAESAYEHLAIRKDGTFFPVEAQSKSLPFKGAMVRVTALRDITQRRRLEEQLRQSQKMESIGQLAGGIAHDFNNLLTIIISYSEILEYLPSDSIEEHLEEIEQIKEAALRAATLTRQLLAFSRRAQVDMRVLNLNTIISDLLKMLERLIGEDIELTMVLAANLGKVKADGGQLEQMIMNLVINARDAMPQGGKLTVETANVYLDAAYARQHYEVQPGWYVMLAVSDTGTGMSAETQSRIFEPFFTTKEQGKGTGLGMAMVHGIIKQSGGHIWIYSEVGHGTTFKIYLPLVEEGESMQLPFHPASATTTGSETVLLVEDDEVVRQLVREILEKQGYRVLEAGCEDAVVVSDHYTGPIALLLTDVVMPKLNGRELAERLLVTRPDLKVLYMSGYTDTVMLHHGLMAEEVAFLQKPFTPGGLAQKVRAVLDK